MDCSTTTGASLCLSAEIVAVPPGVSPIPATEEGDVPHVPLAVPVRGRLDVLGSPPPGRVARSVTGEEGGQETVQGHSSSPQWPGGRRSSGDGH